MKYYAQRVIFYVFLFLVSTDATSQVLWQQVYKDSCPFSELNAIEDNDGHIFILGQTVQSNCTDDKIVEVDQNGNLLNTVYFTNYQYTKLLFNKGNNSFYVFSVRGGGYFANNNYYVISYLNQNTGTVDSLYGIYIPDCWPSISDAKMDSAGNIFISGTDVYNTQNQNETYGIPFLSETDVNGNGIRNYTPSYSISDFSFGKNDTVYFSSYDNSGNNGYLPTIAYLTKLSPDLEKLWQITLAGTGPALQSLYANGQIYAVTFANYGFYVQCFSTNKVTISIDSFSNDLYNPIITLLCDSQILAYKLNTYITADTSIFCTYNNTGELLNRISLPNFNNLPLDIQNIKAADNGNIFVIGSVFDTTPAVQYLSVVCLAQDSLYSCKDVLPQIDFAHLVEIYPNPGFNNISINVKEDNLPTTLNIYNVIGQKMFSSAVTELNTDFNTKILANGLYLFQVINNSSSYSVKEIIQNH